YAKRFSSTNKITLFLKNETSGIRLKYKIDIAINTLVPTHQERQTLHISLWLIYGINSNLAHEVREAATPVHFRLLRSIGNLSDGVKQICDMRANLLYIELCRIHVLALMKTENDKSVASLLHRLEESARELLLVWFCQSNVKLERLTWQSPGDILYKVANHEAVHPVKGPSDLMKRLGNLRRCYYFSHETMPREPLVIVYVALLNDIADNVQHLDSPEDDCTTAIYYSITATQPGLSGIDLGNMLIKSVARLLHSELPSIRTHSTLSPIPGFRTWMLRNLHGSSFYNYFVVQFNFYSEVQASCSLIEMLKYVFLRSCGHYLCSRRQNGFALNSVANFHLKNGAEIYRLNWMGDTSDRGLNNSIGIMVNYR
uniref:MCD domain-containing protein n=1 Tax=Angiostrongylus cantonensis TaxID=6313 RepID=A0A0K0CVM4_ANGCA